MKNLQWITKGIIYIILFYLPSVIECFQIFDQNLLRYESNVAKRRKMESKFVTLLNAASTSSSKSSPDKETKAFQEPSKSDVQKIVSPEKNTRKKTEATKTIQTETNPPKRKRGRPRKNENTAKKTLTMGQRLARAKANAIATSDEKKSLMTGQTLTKGNKKSDNNYYTNRLYGTLRSSGRTRDQRKKEDMSMNDLPMGSLAQLTKVLDEKLHSQGARGAGGDYPALDGLVQQAR